MSNFINSHLIEPALRTARRFSSGPSTPSAHDNPDNFADHPFGNGNEPNAFTREAGLATSSTRHQFAGTLPIDDPQDAYVFEDSPVQSPGEIEDPIASTTPSASAVRTDRTIDSLRSISLDDVQPSMSRNPSLHASDRLRSIHGTSSISIHSGRSGNSVTSGTRRQDDIMAEANNAGRAASPAMSGNLPEDDGMKDLRAQLHKIREMALSSEEKAKAMHELMMADYKAFKDMSAADGTERVDFQPQSPTMLAVPQERHRSPSPGTAAAEYNLQEADLHPTYRPPTPPAEGQQDMDEDDPEPVLGCKHYMRNVKVQCSDCQRWYTCRHCHDEVEKHNLVRKEIKNMLCMLCDTPQAAAEYCRKCHELMAVYYCDICKLWDNDSRRRIYHCLDCGICRVGEGLGKDYVHCKKCNVCINIAAAATHRCVERATECDCPICGEYMFTSAASVVAMKCGHYIHRSCYDAWMETNYKCPICSRSAVNMELQWRKLDRHVEAQPMPTQFANTKAWISCNDCGARTCTAYHWLGNKCTVCGSYNTNQVRLENTPADQEAQGVAEAQRIRMEEQVQELQQPTTAGSPEPLALVAPAEAAGGSIALISGSQILHQPIPAQPSPPASLHTLLGGDISLSPDPITSPYPPPEPTPPHSPPRGRRLTLSTSQQRAADSSAIIDDTDHPMLDQPTPIEEDDVAFWGERLATPMPSMPTFPTGWTMRRVSMPVLPSMPSMPHMQMPTMPNYFPAMPNLPTMPRMGSIGIPRVSNIGMHMPTMQMPSMSMSIPSMPSMPRGLSPSGWGMGIPRMNSTTASATPAAAAAAARSVSTGGEPRSPKSPGFFARIVRQEIPSENLDEDEEEDDGTEDDEDEDMVDEDEDEEEEDRGVGGRMDDLELFGHR